MDIKETIRCLHNLACEFASLGELKDILQGVEAEYEKMSTLVAKSDDLQRDIILLDKEKARLEGVVKDLQLKVNAISEQYESMREAITGAAGLLKG